MPLINLRSLIYSTETEQHTEELAANEDHKRDDESDAVADDPSDRTNDDEVISISAAAATKTTTLQPSLAVSQARIDALYETGNTEKAYFNNMATRRATAALPLYYAHAGRPSKSRPQRATETQIQQRKRKKELEREWQVIRSRWKRRKIDLRTEKDVGNAVLHSVRLAKQMQLEKQTPIANQLNDQEDDEEEGNDTSDEEQEEILRRMLSPKVASTPAEEVPSTDDLRPYAERLDPWELGFSTPSHQPFADYSLFHSIPKQAKANYTPDTDQYTVTNLNYTTNNHSSSYYRLVPQWTLPSYTNAIETHKTLTLRALARSFITNCTQPNVAMLWHRQLQHRTDARRAHDAARQRYDSNLTVTSHFIPIAGAVPPTACLPMDAKQIQWGPHDVHVDVFHKAQLSTVTLALTLSHLLQMPNSKNLVESLFENAIKLNQSRIFIRLQMQKAPKKELPLAGLFAVMKAYLSYLSSQSYEDIEHACEKYLSHNGLQAFASLHLTHGLVLICRGLPRFAADIVGKPLENYETPFHVMQRMLSAMEDSLTDSAVPPTSSQINVGALEYTVYLASRKFGHCIEREPTNVDYHAWYLAALASCMLLCSGNALDGRARAYPSYRQPGDVVGLFGDGSAALQHEVRRRLPKFFELRIQVAQALKLLMRLVEHQGGSRCHWILTSVLEWKQVFALLVGPHSESKGMYENIRVTHKYHLHQWAMQENSKLSRAIMTRQSDRNAELEALALQLESEPSDMHHWRVFVRALGPVVNNDESSQMQWASRRSSWWDTHLLCLSKEHLSLRVVRNSFVAFFAKGKNPMQLLIQHVFPRMREALKTKMNVTQADVKEPNNVDNYIERVPSLDWIMDTVDPDLTGIYDEDKLDASKRGEVFDSFLPCATYPTLLHSVDLDASKFDSPFGSQVSEALEVRCYCILIAVHIYGLSHPGVVNLIHGFMVQAWDTATREPKPMSDPYMACLEWLTMQNIDVVSILREHCRHLEYIPVEVRTALRQGIDMYGVSKWTMIKKEFPDVLKDYDPSDMLRVVYDWMVNQGELDPNWKGGENPPHPPQPEELPPPVVSEQENSTVPAKGRGRKVPIQYTKEQCETLRKGIEMYGLGKWIQIKQHFPKVFGDFYRQKMRYCWDYMVRNGMIDPTWEGGENPPENPVPSKRTRRHPEKRKYIAKALAKSAKITHRKKGRQSKQNLPDVLVGDVVNASVADANVDEANEGTPASSEDNVSSVDQLDDRAKPTHSVGDIFEV